MNKTLIDVDGESFEGEIGHIPTHLVDVDPDNPRWAFDSGKTVAERHKEMLDDINYLKLKESIRENKGISEAIFVQRSGKRYKTREGNTRRLVYDDFPEDSWSKKILACVLPKNMSEEKILKYIGTVHDVGKNGWHSLAKITFAKKCQLLTKKTDAVIAAEHGYPDISVYNLCSCTLDVCSKYIEETGDKNERWYQWYEALKSRHIKMAKHLEDQKIRANCFKIMKEGKLQNPQLSRNLEKIINNKQAFQYLVKADLKKEPNCLEISIEMAKRGVSKTSPAIISMKKSTASLSRSKSHIVEAIRSGEPEFEKALTEHLACICEAAKQAGKAGFVLRVLSESVDN